MKNKYVIRSYNETKNKNSVFLINSIIKYARRPIQIEIFASVCVKERIENFESTLLSNILCALIYWIIQLTW